MKVAYNIFMAEMLKGKFEKTGLQLNLFFSPCSSSENFNLYKYSIEY